MTPFKIGSRAGGGPDAERLAFAEPTAAHAPHALVELTEPRLGNVMGGATAIEYGLIAALIATSTERPQRDR